MRQIVEHQVGGVNNGLKVSVIDDPGEGNACHHYQVDDDNGLPDVVPMLDVRFQNGLVRDVGVNGITNESLMAIVIDRLRGFQDGEFRCRENALALTHLETALMWLQKRTRDRMARGVEGTNAK